MHWSIAVSLLLGGIAIGSALTWLLLRTLKNEALARLQLTVGTERATQIEQLNACQQQIAALRGDLQSARDMAGILQEKLTAESASRSAAQSTADRVPGLEEMLTVANQDNASANAKNAKLASELEAANNKIKEQLDLIAQAKANLGDAFKALAAEALTNNNASFLNLASAKFEGLQKSAEAELKAREAAIGTMLAPVGESLTKLDGLVRAVEEKRANAYGSLEQFLKGIVDSSNELKCETVNLKNALSMPSVRGRWGELTLKRVVELAGMVENCDFVQQENVVTELGPLRPDMVVRLPGTKSIVIDSKVPLMAYLESIETTDQETRRQLLADHARQVKNHFGKLSEKRYWEQFEASPEFVIMFLPAESILRAALEADGSLIELGVQQNVILATPTTLIALLKAVASGWRQERIAANAEQISALGKQLFERVATLADHFGKIGGSLQSAVRAYNLAVGSLETRVFVSARRFKELGVSSDGEIEQLEVISEIPRALDQERIGLPIHIDAPLRLASDLSSQSLQSPAAVQDVSNPQRGD